MCATRPRVRSRVGTMNAIYDPWIDAVPDAYPGLAREFYEFSGNFAHWRFCLSPLRPDISDTVAAAEFWLPPPKEIRVFGPADFEEIGVIGLALPFASVWALLWLLLHAACQFQRMKNEERVLSGAFPEYEDYARRTARVIPGLY